MTVTLEAQRSRGSVSAASRRTTSRSGDTRTWQSPRASGSRTVSKTEEGYNVNKQVQTKGGYSKEVDRSINTEDRTIDRSSTATNPWGQTATRERTC